MTPLPLFTTSLTLRGVPPGYDGRSGRNCDGGDLAGRLGPGRKRNPGPTAGSAGFVRAGVSVWAARARPRASVDVRREREVARRRRDEVDGGSARQVVVLRSDGRALVRQRPDRDIAR